MWRPLSARRGGQALGFSPGMEEMRTGMLVSTGDWRALATLDERVARWTRRQGAWAVVLHELVCFGIKQARACLFGGCMLAQ